MARRTRKILLVEPNPELLEMFVASFAERFDAQVTCVADAESCLDTEITAPHDLIVAELDLPDLDGLQLTERLTALSARPIILLADEPTAREAIEALRLGVRDLFPKPFPLGQLLDAADRALHGFDVHRQHVAKYHKMRGLVRHVLRDRRDLNQRIELICRDLVGAHRRLVHRVLEAPSTP